jgi:hypothetical protein
MASLVQRPSRSAQSPNRPVRQVRYPAAKFDTATYYIQFYLSGKLKRVSTGTESCQIAEEKLRQFESAQARGDELPLPTKTPITDVVSAYVPSHP